MKVYELMDRLSGMPAGAEVKVATMMTTEQLEVHEATDTDEDGAEVFYVEGKPEDIEKTAAGTVKLYVDMGAGA